MNLNPISRLWTPFDPERELFLNWFLICWSCLEHFDWYFFFLLQLTNVAWFQRRKKKRQKIWLLWHFDAMTQSLSFIYSRYLSCKIVECRIMKKKKNFIIRREPKKSLKQTKLHIFVWMMTPYNNNYLKFNAINEVIRESWKRKKHFNFDHRRRWFFPS